MLAAFFCTVFSICPLHSECPSLVKYSRATQAQAAREMRTLPPGATLERMIQDYSRMRDACRAAGAK